MVPIKQDTIIKKGDKIVDTLKNNEWEVKKIEGSTFTLSLGDKEIAVSKFKLITLPELQLKINDNRGYY